MTGLDVIAVAVLLNLIVFCLYIIVFVGTKICRLQRETGHCGSSCCGCLSSVPPVEQLQQQPKPCDYEKINEIINSSLKRVHSYSALKTNEKSHWGCNCFPTRAPLLYTKCDSLKLKESIKEDLKKKSSCALPVVKTAKKSPGVTVMPINHIPWGQPYRAYKTIPKTLVELVPSTIPKAGLGIFAKQFIRKGTYLGQYEGEIVTDLECPSEYSWCVYSESGNPEEEEKLLYYIDGANLKTSNWLRWINCSRHSSEENVEMKQWKGRIMYITSKDIRSGEELLIYYGDDFAEQLEIDLENYDTPKDEIS